MNIAAHEDRPGLRERKKRATWAALHRAALTLVDSRGLDQVTVDDIAAAADVSPRTFFNYFRTKEDALTGVDPHYVDELVATLRDRPESESPVAACRAVLLWDCERVLRGEDLWEKRVRVATRHRDLFQSAWATSAHLEIELTRALAHRMGLDPKRSPLPGILAGTTIVVRRSAVRTWVLGGFTQGYRDVLDSTLAQLAHIAALDPAATGSSPQSPPSTPSTPSTPGPPPPA
ncbi:TetR/AcrR family transcriptional regulator [Pseudactinotalea sp. HY158]|uniref:TetR/AcrR family transcriptional regulator n=1 Tax=Pseudactinotalea sp. HY158 TaxID=2654547 RepID=UPI00129D0129|nr:TetR/AcrR family transcriptional regulator [Pseudactinotalea sp. HY158]QGH68161.1 TetR family transcriptional regulator [Pseudactinotalea sp. HY158]